MVFIEHLLQKGIYQMQKNTLAIFRSVTKEDLKFLGEVQLYSTFSLHRTCQKPLVFLGLTTKYLLYFQDEHSEKPCCLCQLKFDLKFQILRESPVNNSGNLGKPFGIRFELETAPHSYHSLTLYSSNPHLLTTWLHCLEGYLNQRNFHDLFKAKKKIGKGAFATVYLAERLIDHKMVAIKAFSKQKQYAGEKGRQSLQNQIKLMRVVKDQNIMKLEGVYETENSIYVILQIMEGRQLHQRLKNNQIKDPKNIREIIQNILSGLRALSQKRVIHRDLKPENIMFRKEGSNDLAIGDFGLATLAQEEKYLFVRCGTPGFVAPQIINIRDMNTKSDPISDIFSAGLIFHFLLLGHSIFSGTRYNEILAENRACSFNFEKPIYSSVDPIALDLLKRMLEVNPHMRICAQKALDHPYFQDNESFIKSQKLAQSQMIDEKYQNSTISHIDKKYRHQYYTRNRNTIHPTQAPSRQNKHFIRKIVVESHHHQNKENVPIQKLPFMKKNYSVNEGNTFFLRRSKRKSIQETMR